MHEYDNQIDSRTIDYFDLQDGRLGQIDEDITDPDQSFKLLVINADLSDGGG